MSPRKKKLFVPAAQQVETAQNLSKAIVPSNFGYDIHPLTGYGHTPYDYLLVHRQAPTRIVAVLLQPNGSVSVRLFTAWGSRNSLLQLIVFEVERCCPLRVWHKRYLPRSKKPGGWEHLVAG